jgi:type VI secretion system protein ImpM
VHAAALDPEAGGFYGKLPSRGDFVRRGLPRELVEPWHAAMAAALADPAAPLEAAWAQAGGGEIRFLLGPGAAGAAPWCGLALPSADAVGRRFPLMLAVRLQHVARAGGLAEPGGALDRLAVLGAAALGGAAPEALEAALAPELAAAAAAQAGDLALLGEPPPALLFRGCTPFAAALAVALEGGHGFWWRPALPGRAPACLLAAGLPGPAALAALLGAAP